MSGLALEEYELLEDPKYRAYVASVDKALRNFESTSEWADLISTLGKLYKVLLSHMKYPVVPRRIVISKRLAQCLHPALPSGVHLKTLEIYDIIFKCMGTNRLSQELFIYSAGLFPLFGSAAMHVRSALLMIYETHFVPLGARLRPGLNGFLSGVLSGLEEGSDHLERTALLLQRVAEGVGKQEFFGCLWECILNNSGVRLPAITHINACYNKKLSTEDQLYILGTNIDIMVHGLCRALEDNTVLVQRAALDLTLSLLPMHNTQLLRDDLTSIVASSLLVLLRRDMSLNRRLYAWMLGTEVNLSLLPSEHPVVKRIISFDGGGSSSHDKSDNIAYFEAYSKSLLIEAFVILLRAASSSSSGPDPRPCKIILPLLDKPDIGPDILDQIFLDFLRYLYHTCHHLHSSLGPESNTFSSLHSPSTEIPHKQPDRQRYEVSKVAMLVFSALQPSYPWERLLFLLREFSKTSESNLEEEEEDSSGFVQQIGCSKIETREIFCLMNFMLRFLPLDSEQQLDSAHLPFVLSFLLQYFIQHIDILSPEVLLMGVELCKGILRKLIPSVMQPNNHTASQSITSVNALHPPLTQFNINSRISEFSPFFHDPTENGIIQIGIEAEEKRKESPPPLQNHLKPVKISSPIENFSRIDVEDSSVNECAAKDSSQDGSVFDGEEILESNKYHSSSHCMNPELQARVSGLQRRLTGFPSICLSDSFEVDLSSSDGLDKTNDADDTFESAVENFDVVEGSLYKYVRDFLHFFVIYLEKRILHSSSSSSKFENFLFNQMDELNNYADLKGLLHECLSCLQVKQHPYQKGTSKRTTFKLPPAFSDRLYDDLRCFTKIKPSSSKDNLIFKVICSTLVDLSSIPANEEPLSPLLANAKQNFPPWLLSLLLCIVIGGQISPSFAQTAMSTLIELISLAQSDLSVWKNVDRPKRSSEDSGSTTLQILPLLQPQHTHTILYRTYMYQFMTRELWNHLGEETKDLHISATDLLFQMHSLSLFNVSICASTLYPQCISIVEKEILKTLVASPEPLLYSPKLDKVKWSPTPMTASNSDSSAIIKWITLWQVSRSLSRGTSPSCSGFNRCLFLMIERLQSQFGKERSFSHNWLGESLDCGDLARILDPILLFLLHPNTRRISVQHVDIKKLSQESSTNEDDEECSQIYAISSVGGEVFYHIGKGPNKSLRPSSQVLSSLKKQLVSITGSNKDNYSKKYVTQQVNLTNYEVPLINKEMSGVPISFMVNPFSHHPWIDINDLTKFNNSSCLTNRVTHVTSKSAKKEEPKWSSKDLVQSLLDEIIERVITPKFECDFADLSSTRGSSSEPPTDTTKKEAPLHPLHSHLLLYMQVVDSSQCLYGLNLIKNILEAQSRQFLVSLASTSITPQHNSSSPLLILLGRHRRSIFGKGFDGGNPSEMVGNLRSAMYLQVIITICLYFIRSYYPRQPHLHLQEQHLHDNRELQVFSAELLESLFSHLMSLVTSSPRGFNPYIKDVLNECKVQKCVLHCLLSAVNVMNEKSCNLTHPPSNKSFSEDILEYNFSSLNPSPPFSNEQPYIFSLMSLCLSLIKLEDVLMHSKGDSIPKDFKTVENLQNPAPTATSLRYIFGRPVPSQPMFLWALTLALNHKGMKHHHMSWLHLFTSALPYMGAALPLNSLRTMNILCNILEDLSTYYASGKSLPPVAPSDYTLHILTGLTNVVQFCLLEASQSQVMSSSASSASSSTSSTTQTPGQILYNLLHVFSPAGEVLEASLDTSSIDPYLCARKTILSHLPRLISSLLSLWISTSPDKENGVNLLGNRQVVRQQIVEMLSPICHHHTPHLLAALSVVWQGATEDDLFITSNNRLIPIGSLWDCNPRQVSLVEMLATLKVLPLHSLIDNVKQVFRHPPIVEGVVQKKLPLEVSVLQLFYVYVRETSATNQLAVCWGPLLSLVKEGILCLPPPALLVLLASFNEFVQRIPPAQDKKEIREQQDVAAKLLDAISSIAGSRLEATTWLRRNLTVKADVEDEEQSKGNSSNSSLSVAALTVLAELLAPLLDVLYSSEEKEKVIPLLMSIMANVIPYLRKHSSSNMAAFHACSQLLSSLSGYQYTLKAWRKDVFELLLETFAFKMLPETLPYWRILVDNLCTHDKTVFKELLGKISISQSGSLNLFTNKESEYENCAGLLKRLSFTIFCSETDQYLKLIPDIQERLTEVTRLGQVIPGLVAQVLLCFRVLLLRISPRGTMSLWPIIITELVQVFLMMEQELSTDSEQFSKKSSSSHLRRLSTLDYKWVVGAHNGLHAHNHPAWLSLYLAACKLLDLMMALPASHLPQFQMYRWAFVGVSPSSPEPPEPDKNSTEWAGCYLLRSCEFIPHLTRISRIMSQKFAKGDKDEIPPELALPKQAGRLLLTTPSINGLRDLQPFFHSLTLSYPNASSCLSSKAEVAVGGHHDGPPSKIEAGPEFNLSHIEAAIGRDFLEPVTS